LLAHTRLGDVRDAGGRSSNLSPNDCGRCSQHTREVCPGRERWKDSGSRGLGMLERMAQGGRVEETAGGREIEEAGQAKTESTTTSKVSQSGSR
jgi:hypothetical protein